MRSIGHDVVCWLKEHAVAKAVSQRIAASDKNTFRELIVYAENIGEFTLFAILTLCTNLMPKRVGIHSLSKVFPRQVIVGLILDVVIDCPTLCDVVHVQLPYPAAMSILIPGATSIHG